jgi:hypothetical protein
MTYKYEIPSETNFRNYTVDEAVTDLDPDGFTTDESTGDSICEDVLSEAGLIAAPQWDTYGADGAMRLLYWESEEDADNDDGANAMGQIVKTPVTDEDAE